MLVCQTGGRHGWGGEQRKDEGHFWIERKNWELGGGGMGWNL